MRYKCFTQDVWRLILEILPDPLVAEGFKGQPPRALDFLVEHLFTHGMTSATWAPASVWPLWPAVWSPTA